MSVLPAAAAAARRLTATPPSLHRTRTTALATDVNSAVVK